MTVKEIYPAMRLCFRALVFVSVAFLSSCDEDITEERDPCDFVRSIDEVLLDSNGSTFQESFLNFPSREGFMISGTTGFVTSLSVMKQPVL
ncbi:MAG: hypothetical protein HWD62_02560 [Cyclobacteriaceae bacterium]|nr:MAG: hypothetical protein HWD62_02560 [Cyclobacteriaceae bacterium]